MRKLLRLALVLVALMVAGVAVFLTAAYRATQQVPEFYQVALANEKPQEQKAAADELEREVLNLHKEAKKPGRWVARFSQDQINGWLAADLPAKFPGVLPRGVSQPRVAIEPNKMQMAVKFKQGDVETVLSLAGDAYLTDRPNEVAIHIQHVRAGLVPVPLAKFMDNIAEEATDAGLPLRWSEQEGDPVAIVTLPLDRKEFRGKQLRVEELQINAGEIVVSGQTEEPDENGETETADATDPTTAAEAEFQAEGESPAASDTRQR